MSCSETTNIKTLECLNLACASAFAILSVTSCSVEIQKLSIFFCSYFSPTKWYHKLMCFVLLWYSGLFTSRKALSLSLFRTISPFRGAPILESNLNHIASLVAIAASIYFASLVDCAVQYWLYELQAITHVPSRNTYPDLERRVSASPA